MTYLLLSAAAVCLIVHSIYNAHGISTKWRERAAFTWLVLATAFHALAIVLWLLERSKGGAA